MNPELADLQVFEDAPGVPEPTYINTQPYMADFEDAEDIANSVSRVATEMSFDEIRAISAFLRGAQIANISTDTLPPSRIEELIRRLLSACVDFHWMISVPLLPMTRHEHRVWCGAASIPQLESPNVEYDTSIDTDEFPGEATAISADECAAWRMAIEAAAKWRKEHPNEIKEWQENRAQWTAERKAENDRKNAEWEARRSAEAERNGG